MDYIARIKQIKGEKKITNDKLSALTGIPLGTLSKLLAGISDSPKLSNIVSIANALGCSLDYLVSGTPDNTNNFTASAEEIRLIEYYRSTDTHGKELIRLVAEKEAERTDEASVTLAAPTSVLSSKAKILPTVGVMGGTASSMESLTRRTIQLYDLPVSAGPGVYLDDTATEEISIPDNDKTKSADFALKISGNSMEPKYHNGDILLVQDADFVEVGELGVFILDGNGYFKKYGGDRLISLNEEYGDILLKDYAEVVCCGRVTGKLRKR